MAVYLYNLAAWAINADGTATDDLKAWLGISTSGVTAPTNLTASDGSSETEVTVAWTGVSGATSYQIWRSNTNDSAAAAVIGSSVTTTYSDTSVTLGTVYYYFAKTISTSGTSGFSNLHRYSCWSDGDGWDQHHPAGNHGICGGCSGCRWR